MVGNANQQTPISAQPGPIAQHLQNGHQPVSQYVIQAPSPSRKHFQWTGFAEKTLWDWFQLLGAVAIPIVVVFVSVGYSHDLQIARDQQQQAVASARDQQRQTTYDTYLDHMSNLIISQKLPDSKPGDGVRTLAHAYTLAALEVLDPIRKGQLLHFLYDAHLVDQHVVVGLQGANLIGANLSGVNLSDANLSSANLSYANLSSANLSGADLSYAKLSGANLSGANLNGANLSYANLSGANLRGADLRGAKLSGAKLSKTDLRGAKLSGANLGGADLNYADLNYADLSKTDLRGANLSDAEVTNAQLLLVSSLQSATMLMGLIHP